jgi:hypothetical protein
MILFPIDLLEIILSNPSNSTKLSNGKGRFTILPLLREALHIRQDIAFFDNFVDTLVEPYLRYAPY